MIHLDIPQGSREWFEARLGIPTASEFDRILTPKTLKLSAQADSYMHEKLAEWMTNQPFERVTSVWTMERGIELEQEAADYYELTTGLKTRPAGFCLTDDRSLGASPDRLVGDEGLLELKCPLAHTQVSYLLNKTLPSEYLLQVQGQLYVTSLPWCDFLSYYPGLPSLLIRNFPSPVVQKALQEALEFFLRNLNEAKIRLTYLKREESEEAA